MKWSKLCVIVIFCGALIACTSEDEHAATSHSFVPGGIHASTIDYMDEFEVYSGMLEELSVHIEDTVYSDSLAGDLCVAIEDDLQALHQIGVFLNENEIYIVESLKHSEIASGVFRKIRSSKKTVCCSSSFSGTTKVQNLIISFLTGRRRTVFIALKRV